jgi:signal transduction histidine kinase
VSASSSDLGPLLPQVRLDELLSELQNRMSDVLRTRDRVHELLDAVLAVGSDLDLQTVLRRIVDAAVRLVDAQYGALGVIGGTGYLAQFLTSGIDEADAVRIGQLPRGHGILGVLIRDPRPLRLDDLGSHQAAYGFPPHHPPMKTFLGVPVRVRDAVFGNLYLTEKHGGASFDEEDEAVVLALATAAGVAIENARLYEQARRRERWVSASAEVSTALLSGRDPEDALPLVARLAAELARADTALVALPQAEVDALLVEVAVGTGAENLVGRRVSSPVAAARASGQAAALDPDDGPHELVTGRQAGSGVVVPLGEAGDRGVLVVASGTGQEPVRLEAVPELQAFAAQAAVALELAERRRDAELLPVFEERDRIARDLHDVVIQRLFATGMQLESASRLLGPEPATRVRRAVDDLDATIREIRSSIYALQTVPSSIEQPRLRARVLEVVDAGAELLGFRPELRLGGLVDTGVPAATGEHLLAVLREALSNAARHAVARHVVVQLDVHDDVRLLVRDDGVGLPDHGRRSGLANLAARASGLGGTLSVRSLPPPERGTELVWTAPLPPA